MFDGYQQIFMGASKEGVAVAAICIWRQCPSEASARQFINFHDGGSGKAACFRQSSTVSWRHVCGSVQRIVESGSHQVSKSQLLVAIGSC